MAIEAYGIAHAGAGAPAMLRAVSAPLRTRARVIASLAIAGSTIAAPMLSACGDDEGDAGGTAPVLGAAGSTSKWHETLAKGDVDGLLAALQQGHLRARTGLGPHRMKIHSELALAPEGEPATHEPAVDELRPTPQHVVDDLELVWATTEPNRPRFSLVQTNDHERGREVVVDGTRMYTRHRHRAWYVQELQADLHELWLDDAQRSIYDAIALAAPRLAVQATEEAGAGIGGGAAIRFALATAATSDPNRALAKHGQAWRADAEIDEVSGSVLVDAGSGLWLSAEVHVRYGMPGPDGRRLRGSVDASAEVAPVSPEAAEIVIPSDAQPLLERTRYEAERARLLDGLAGP